jgi:hypothetical protein
MCRGSNGVCRLPGAEKFRICSGGACFKCCEVCCLGSIHASKLYRRGATAWRMVGPTDRSAGRHTCPRKVPEARNVIGAGVVAFNGLAWNKLLVCDDVCSSAPSEGREYLNEKTVTRIRLSPGAISPAPHPSLSASHLGAPAPSVRPLPSRHRPFRFPGHGEQFRRCGR